MSQHQFHMAPNVPIPEDGGYPILSGLSRQFPFLHGRSDIQIAPVRGSRTDRKGWLRTDRSSVLHIRGLSPDEVQQVSGSWFNLGGHLVGLSKAEAVEVRPAPTLASRMVIFDLEGGSSDPFPFLNILIGRVPTGCEVALGRQRTFRLKGRVYIGYGVRLSNLSTEASLEVQGRGVGRFTSMGCGVFAPTRDA